MQVASLKHLEKLIDVTTGITDDDARKTSTLATLNEARQGVRSTLFKLGVSKAAKARGVHHAAPRGNSMVGARNRPPLGPLSSKGDAGRVATQAEDSPQNLQDYLQAAALRQQQHFGEGNRLYNSVTYGYIPRN